MSSAEFTLWAQYLWTLDGIEDDVRAGVIAAAVQNSAGGKKDGSAFQPRDYFRRLRTLDAERVRRRADEAKKGSA